ncbi:MAG: DUF6134 family protein [Myxococcota bacterium]
MFLVLISLLTAGAAEPTQITWELGLNGKKIGERELVVRVEEIQGLEFRTLQAKTKVDGRIFGIDFAYQEKLTANADIGPASFINVVEQGGRLSEVQGRRTGAGWVVTVKDPKRTRIDEMKVDDVDLSTADLLDPHSRVPLSRFETARILSAETGEVLSGPVEPLGPSDVQIGGQSVAVEGYRWSNEQFKGTFYYTSDGWLVRFDTRVMGQRVSGVLTDPPPTGVDDAPIDVFGPGLDAVEL